MWSHLISSLPVSIPECSIYSASIVVEFYAATCSESTTALRDYYRHGEEFVPHLLQMFNVEHAKTAINK